MTSMQLIFHLAAEVLEHRRSLAQQLHTIILVHGASEPELAVRILAVYRVDMARDPQAFTDIYEFDGRKTQLSPDKSSHHRIFVFDVEKDISHSLQMPMDHVALRLDKPLNFDLCARAIMIRANPSASSALPRPDWPSSASLAPPSVGADWLRAKCGDGAGLC